MDESTMDESAQKAPRAGRRARQGFEAIEQPGEEPPPPASAQDNSTSEAALERIDDNAPPPPRAAPAFGEEPSSKKFAGLSRRKQEQLDKGDDSSLDAKNKKKYDNEEAEASIMDIPELEEEGQEDITRQVADAPRVRAQRVQDIAELEGASQYLLPEPHDKDLDLSLLTSCLCSLDQVQEPDEVWDPDQLFAQLASDLHAEEDKADAKNNSVGVADRDSGGGGIKP